MLKSLLLITVLVVLLPNVVFAQIPSGIKIDFDRILNLVASFGNYLYTAALIVASVAFVWAGLAYLLAGADSGRLKKAKDILKNGVIGAFILLGIGVITSTILLFAGNPAGFFGTGPGISGGGGVQLTAYGCNAENQCVQMVGGLFPDSTSTCDSYCATLGGGPGAQSDACFDCVDPDGDGVGNGGSFCLADNKCYVSENDCQGVFTKVPGGCS